MKPFEYAEAKIPFYPPSKQWGKLADPITKMQKPLSTEESVKHIITPKDFEVKVFVTETQLGGKPICMNWDEQGRLWVAITVDYPNELQREGQGRDRIVVCFAQPGHRRVQQWRDLRPDLRLSFVRDSLHVRLLFAPGPADFAARGEQAAAATASRH